MVAPPLVGQLMLGAIVQLVGGVWVAGIQAFAEQARKPEPPEKWPPVSEWLDVPKRTIGDPIPVVFGTVWLNDPHVVWVTDARGGVLKITSGAGGLVVGFETRRRFVAGMAMVLCQGPLDTLSRIDVADQVLAGSSDLVGVGALMGLTAGPVEIEVWDPHIHGASQSLEQVWNDGVGGRFGIAPGLPAQAGLVIPRWGVDRGNLRGVSTAWFRGPGPDFDWDSYDAWPSPQRLTRSDGSTYDDPYAFYFAARPEPPAWRFLATRTQSRAAGVSQWYTAKSAVVTNYDLTGATVRDLNPVHVLVEMLCDPTWGLDLGDPGDVIDETEFEALADAFALEGVGIGISWVWDREAARGDIVQQIERICDVVLEHEPADDLWHLRSWTSAATPVEIGDDDLVGEPEFDLTSADELPTTIHVTWHDRRRDSEQTYVLQDLAALHVRGREIVHYWSIPMIASPVTVPQLARRELARLTTPRLQAQIEVMREVGESLRRTDLVHLVSTEHGVDGTFRVIEWDHGVRTDGTVRLTLIADPTIDADTPIWHEPGDPEEVEPEELPELSPIVQEMPLHAWWAIDDVPDLPDRLWAVPPPDQITRLWLWATRPADRWDLDGWRWADRLLDEAGDPEGYITVSPEVSAFSGELEVMVLDRGNDRLGTDTIEHDGTKVLRAGDIIAVPLADETPITVLSSVGLSLDDRGGLVSRNYDYSQMAGGYEFVIVVEVTDATHVVIRGGLWDTLPARQIGGTSYVVGHYPVISPWACAPDELQVSGAGQVRRAPSSVDDAPDYIRDAIQTGALAVSGARLQEFDLITPLEVPLSGADAPSTTDQDALTRPIRPLVGAAFEIFDIDDGGDSRIAITVEPRTRNSRLWAPSTLALSGVADSTAIECCVWPDTGSGNPPLILWVIDPSSGDVIATRGWTTAYGAGQLALSAADEKALHDTIHGGEELFESLTLIVTAEGAFTETLPAGLKSMQSWHYVRFDLARLDENAAADYLVDIRMEVTDTLRVALPAFFDHVWEATDIAGLANNDDVTTWVAQVGGVDLAQSSASLKPHYKVSEASNGLPSVYFPGHMSANIGTIAQPATYIVVMEIDSEINGEAVFDFTTARHHLWSDGVDYDMFHSSSVNTGFDNSPGLKMLACVFNGASSFMRIDGAKGSAVSPGTGSATGSFRIGANNSGTFGMQGVYVHGIYIAKSGLSDAQLDQAQAYCATKWSTAA